MNKLTLNIYFTFLSSLFFLSQNFGNNCDDAVLLDDVLNWCSDTAAFNNTGALVDMNVPQPNCWPTLNNDIWFTFKAVTENASISVVGFGNIFSGGTMLNPQMVLYTGVCGALEAVACVSDVFNDGFIQINAEGLIIDQSYFLRIDDRIGNTGTFQVCIDHSIEFVDNEYPDCEEAFDVCSNASYQFSSTVGIGNVNDNVGETCVQAEFSPTWFRFRVEEAGWLTFVITPDKPSDDIDFVLFKLNDEGEKNVVRCMASGQNVGQPFSSWEACTGATGLDLNETDTIELPGCQTDDNNFLAALDAESGDEFILLINNYFNSGHGFSIDFEGTAKITCETTSIENEDISDTGEKITFFPNPASNEISLKINDPSLVGGDISIYDFSGKLIFYETTSQHNLSQISLRQLTAGFYIIKFEKEGINITAKLIVQK